MSKLLLLSLIRVTLMTVIQAYLVFCWKAQRQHLICAVCKICAAWKKKCIIHAWVVPWHIKYTAHASCMCVCLSSCGHLSGSYYAIHEMPELWEIQTLGNTLSYVCTSAHAVAVLKLCSCRTGICNVSSTLSHCSAELSPSPGCSSNWLNLPGKLRGWLEAPTIIWLWLNLE